MDDDLNSPRAIAAVFGLIHHVERHLSNGDLKPENAGVVISFLDEINQVFGIFYETPGDGDEKQTDLPPELKALFRRRLKARENRDWDLADQLREELGAAGVEVRDGHEGSTWEWKRSPKE
jgi:cysteinyl-tRNA synthetase